MIDIKGVQGFIPSSQLLSYFVPDENVTDSSVEVDVTGRKNLEKNIVIIQKKEINLENR